MKKSNFHIIFVLLCISLVLNLYFIISPTLYNDGPDSNIPGTYKTDVIAHLDYQKSFILAIDMENQATLYTEDNTIIFTGNIKFCDYYYAIETNDKNYILHFDGKVAYLGYQPNDSDTDIMITLALKKVSNIPQYLK